MIISDPKNAFNFAYKGFQYPLPPAWKRAIRLEDQIQWLLQALLMLNDEGIQNDELKKALAELENKLNVEILAGDEAQKIYTNYIYGLLQDEINAISKGDFIVSCPVDGNNETASKALKHVFNYLLYFGATYADVKAWSDTENSTYSDVYLLWMDRDYQTINKYAGFIIEKIKEFPPTF